MSKIERELGQIRDELRGWEMFGKGILSEEISSLFNQINPEETKKKRLINGVLITNSDGLNVRLGTVVNTLLEDNPEGKVELCFVQQLGLQVINRVTRRAFYLIENDHPDLEFIESFELGKPRSEVDGPFKDLTPHQKFRLAIRVVKLLSEKFQLEDTMEKATVSS